MSFFTAFMDRYTWGDVIGVSFLSVFSRYGTFPRN